MKNKLIRICDCCGGKQLEKNYWKKIIDNDEYLKDVSKTDKRALLNYILMIKESYVN